MDPESESRCEAGIQSRALRRREYDRLRRIKESKVKKERREMESEETSKVEENNERVSVPRLFFFLLFLKSIRLSLRTALFLQLGTGAWRTGALAHWRNMETWPAPEDGSK
jgi:hypothetical protein